MEDDHLFWKNGNQLDFQEIRDRHGETNLPPEVMAEWYSRTFFNGPDLVLQLFLQLAKDASLCLSPPLKSAMSELSHNSDFMDMLRKSPEGADAFRKLMTAPHAVEA